MLCIDSKTTEQERSLLGEKSLETCPPEIRQSLAYVLHLRSQWKPEGRAKLVVPASWMEFLAFDDKCATDCVAKQHCPFRNVRFDSDSERAAGSSHGLPPDVVLQLLRTDCSLATFVPRAFESMPRTSPRSDVLATSPTSHPRSPPRGIDFALVPRHDGLPESDVGCLVFGMKEPTDLRPTPAGSDPRSGPPPKSASIPEELTNHGQRQLTLLASLMRGGTVGTTAEPFPEWLTLFGLVYSARHVRIVAYVPRRRRTGTLSDVTIDCTKCVVDQLSLPVVSATAAVPVSSCEAAVERLRLLVALMALRRHVLRLSNSLFTPFGPHDRTGRTDDRVSSCGCDQHRLDDSEDSRSLDYCGSLQRSSEYSTCPSSLRTRESNYVKILIKCGDEFSSSRTCCSTCSSLLESASTIDSLSSESCEYSDDPSTLSRSQGSNERVICPKRLTEIKKREIIVWAWGVIPTENPVKDNYKMVIHHSHPRQQRDTGSKSTTSR